MESHTHTHTHTCSSSIHTLSQCACVRACGGNRIASTQRETQHVPVIPVTQQNSVNASQQNACPGSCSGSFRKKERGETHGHVLFLRAHLPGPFLLQNAAPHRQLTAKEMREEKVTEEDLWKKKSPVVKEREEGGVGVGRRQGQPDKMYSPTK